MRKVTLQNDLLLGSSALFLFVIFIYFRAEIYYGISFMVCTIIQLISMLIFDAIVPLVTLILQLVMILLTQVVFPLLTVVVSLLTVVSNLLHVIAVLTIPVGGLLIAALFTCPSENTFMPWFQSFISFAMKEPPKQPTTQPSTEQSTTTVDSIESTKSTQPQKSHGRLDRLYQYTMDSAKKYIINPLFPMIVTKLMIKDQQFMFFGFCRMAYCTMTNDDEIVFIGVFNTWFPWKTK